MLLFAVVTFLFLCSLRRWGNANRVAVCGSPCVLFLATLHRPRPVHHRTTLSSRSPPRSVFFFFVLFSLFGFLTLSRLFLSFSLSLSLSLSFSLSLSLCLSLSLSLSPRLYMHAFVIDRQGVAYQTAPPGGPPHCNYDGFRFLGQSAGQWPGLPVLSCRCSPHFLPLSPKVGAGRGSGGCNRTVTQTRSLSTEQVLSHNCWFALPLFEGECCPFFHLCFFVAWILSFVFLAEFSFS